MRTTLLAGAALTLALAAAALPAGGAAAATDPTPPAGQSVAPGYGALIATLVVDGEFETFAACSGSLVAPDRFLTAGHCFSVLTQMFEVSQFGVTFDEQLPPASDPNPLFPPVELDAAALSNVVPVNSWQIYPGARVAGNPVFDDVAVATLAEPVTDRTPVTLAPVGTLDRALRGSTFDIVGYGVDAQWILGRDRSAAPGLPGAYVFDGRRETTSVTYRSLTPTFLLGSQHVVGSGSGSCSGDSGAPVLMTPAGATEPVVVALAVWGDGGCRSLAGMQRLDTPEIEAFLADAIG